MMVVMQPDDMSSEALQSEPIVERKEVLSTLEDTYRCIKEATGVADVQVEKSSPAVCVLLYSEAFAPFLIGHAGVSVIQVNANFWFLTNEFVSLDG